MKEVVIKKSKVSRLKKKQRTSDWVKTPNKKSVEKNQPTPTKIPERVLFEEGSRNESREW